MGQTAPAFDVTEYSDGDTQTDAPAGTGAFQRAVDACAEAGGGTVQVPAGEYDIGTLRLRSDVTLHLDAGATVAATTDRSEYDSGGTDESDAPFVVASDAENVAITGRGEFDGRARGFLDLDTPIKYHGTEPHPEYPLVSNGPHEARQGEDYIDASQGTDDWPVAKTDFRPTRLFRFVDCENVQISGVTMADMPSHTISLLRCAEVDVRGVDIVGHRLVPNNDGIAVADSRNVHISDCTVVTCDDSIVFDGTPDPDYPCENVTVTNCTLESSACAIKFGSRTDGVMRDFTFQNIVVTDTNRALGIQHRDSGVLENVLFSDVLIQTRLPSGPWWGKAEPIYVTCVPRDDDTEAGTVRNVRFSNVVAQCENGALIYGSEEATIENVSFENVRLEIGASENSDRVGGNFDLQPTSAVPPIFGSDIAGVHCEGATGVDLEDVTVEWVDSGGTTANAVDGLPDYYTHGLQCVDVSDLSIRGFDGRQAHTDSDDGAIALRDVEMVSIRDSRARPGTGRFLELDGVSDPRLFAGNDLTDADASGLADESGDGSGDGFAMSGNRPPQ